MAHELTQAGEDLILAIDVDTATTAVGVVGSLGMGFEGVVAGVGDIKDE